MANLEYISQISGIPVIHITDVKIKGDFLIINNGHQGYDIGWLASALNLSCDEFYAKLFKVEKR